MEDAAQIGTDISTMEAIQSLFSDQSDPWALECLANWIDVTINHAATFYALPKRREDLPEDIVLPNVLSLAQREGLILPAEDQPSADQIDLEQTEIERLYLVFEAWASTHLEVLKEWLSFTTSVRRIEMGRFIDEGL